MMENLRVELFEECFFEDYFKLRSESSNIKDSGFNTTPNYTHLLEIYKRRRLNPERKDFLFFENQQLVGYGYYDLRSGDIDIGAGVSERFSNIYTLSLFLQYIIDIVKEKYPNKQIIFVVSKERISLIKIIEDLGFINTHKVIENEMFGIKKDYGNVELYILKRRNNEK